jgi:hypothetical protein
VVSASSAGVREHRRIVVVGDPRVGRDLLGDLVGVLHGRQAGADAEELPDARLGGQIAHDPDEEPPGLLGHQDDLRIDLCDRVPGGPVGGEVVLAARLVVPHASRMRHVRLKVISKILVRVRHGTVYARRPASASVGIGQRTPAPPARVTLCRSRSTAGRTPRQPP